MNSQLPDNPERRQTLLILAAVVGISLLAVSGRSLWIDEACTALKARQPALTGWWQTLVREQGSDPQMPLYMLFVWAWARIFGSSEWSLHAANLPWFAAGGLVFILSFTAEDRRRFIAACLVMSCPFAWYYLDEARPYAMQLGASLAVVGSLRSLARAAPEVGRKVGEPSDSRFTGAASLSERGSGGRGGGWLMAFLLGLVALSGSSLLGMIWACAALAALLVVLSKGQVVSLLKNYLALWLATGGLLLILCVYYPWTLGVGARASAMLATTLGSVLFAAYELLGFAGLGPGRLALRSAELSTFHPYLLWLALYAVAVATLLGAAVRPMLTSGNRRQLALALCCSVPPAFILMVGCVARFRVLGRHFAPLVAVLILLFTFGLADMWSRRNSLARLPAALFCALSVFSCLSLRFAARHEKDNYRAAAAVARAALGSGQQVWWNAAKEGAAYYDLPVAAPPALRGEAIFLRNPVRPELDALPPPELIVASRPDLYDSYGALAGYARDRGFQPLKQFSAFILLQPKGRQ